MLFNLLEREKGEKKLFLISDEAFRQIWQIYFKYGIEFYAMELAL